MASQQATAFVFIYLILSGPQLSLTRRLKKQREGLVEARRVDVHDLVQQDVATQDLSAVMDTQALMEEMEIENKADAEWCMNPSQSRKTYRIEVQTKGEDCTHGVCTSYEFIRDPERPILRIHHGQSWVVAGKYNESTGETSVEWSLVRSNEAERCWDEEHNIFDAKIIAYGAANFDRGLREYVHFTWADNNVTNISGGVYYQEGLMLRGITELKASGADERSTSEVYGDGSEDARDTNIIWHSAKQAAPVGSGVGLAGVVGFHFVATYVLGNTIKNTALVKAALVGGVGGGALLTVLGAAVGTIIGLLGLAGVVKLLRDQGLSGADKLFDKLWCLDLTTCVKDQDSYHGEGAHAVTILVPDGEKCPDDGDSSWWFR